MKYLQYPHQRQRHENSGACEDEKALCLGLPRGESVGGRGVGGHGFSANTAPIRVSHEAWASMQSQGWRIIRLTLRSADYADAACDIHEGVG